jgi:hypothetical protein
MVFVWAQFELQVGIMCASAPSLRAFFRRYLGGTQPSNSDSQTTLPKKSITIVRDSVSGSVGGDLDGSSLEKREFHEMRELGMAGSEGDGDDGCLRSSRTRERDLTRFFHEEDMVPMF